MNCKRTQAERLFDHLREYGACSTLNLLMTGISTCPWKRIAEGVLSGKLKKGEKLVKGVNWRGVVTYEITRAR